MASNAGNALVDKMEAFLGKMNSPDINESIKLGYQEELIVVSGTILLTQK